MTTQAGGAPRRLRAAIVGLGLDGADDSPIRHIITGADYVVVGGSDRTHAEMVETMLRLESELERLGQRLGDVSPGALAEIAFRIDSPELHAIALRLKSGLEQHGRSFHESSAEELTELSAQLDP